VSISSNFLLKFDISGAKFSISTGQANILAKRASGLPPFTTSPSQDATDYDYWRPEF